MIVGDLFAGVGGLSEGFRMDGFDIGFAIEFDKEIAESYKLNHPTTDVIADDISKVDVEDLHKKHPDIDVIIGGPPIITSISGCDNWRTSNYHIQI